MIDAYFIVHTFYHIFYGEGAIVLQKYINGIPSQIGTVRIERPVIRVDSVD